MAVPQQGCGVIAARAEFPLGATPDDIAGAAADINAASAEMGQAIKAIEEFLELKNIGVPAWTKVKGWEEPETGAFFRRELGYDRVAEAWHIAIRETSGNEACPEQSDVSVWSFNSAPRKSRISAVDKLPDLLKELVKESERVARRIREKTVEVNAFAASLNIATTPKKAKK